VDRPRISIPLKDHHDELLRMDHPLNDLGTHIHFLRGVYGVHKLDVDHQRNPTSNSSLAFNQNEDKSRTCYLFGGLHGTLGDVPSI